VLARQTTFVMHILLGVDPGLRRDDE
jgi:hypothetical protein